MANIVELKDGSGTKAYPITKGEAVYYTGSKTVDKKIHEMDVAADTAATIMPIYIGDYIISTNYLPSCTVKIGNYFYVFNAPSTSYAEANRTNIGKLQVFDVENNTELKNKAKDLKIGHANSVCYNRTENAIYVVPLFGYETGTATTIKKIYKFDLDFETITELDTPSYVNGIAYDYVTDTMYYRYRSSGYADFYKYVNGSWEYFTQVDLSNCKPYIATSGNRSYNQDTAVKNGIFYMSAPHGNIVYGELTEGTATVSGSYILSNIDVGKLYRIGELEGFEFDEDGHLYASQYTTLNAQCHQGFVTEIPISNSFPTSSSGSLFSVHYATAKYLGTDDPIFYTPDVRSINVLRNRLIRSNNLSIAAGEVVKEEYRIIVDDSVAIQLSGELQCLDHFEIQRGALTINANSDSNRLTCMEHLSSPTFVFANRSVGLNLIGDYALNVNLPGKSSATPFRLINPASSFGETGVRLKPACIDGQTELRIGNNPIIRFSMYRGESNIVKLASYTCSFTYGTMATACITDSSRRISFFLPYNLQIDTGEISSATISSGKVVCRGIVGYIISSDGFFLNNYQTSVTRITATGFYISVQFDSPLTYVNSESNTVNYPNNTPVHLIVSEAININLTY